MNSDLVPECEGNWFGCDDKCVRKVRICNTFDECDDGTDELECPGESIFIVLVNYHLSVQFIKWEHYINMNEHHP